MAFIMGNLTPNSLIIIDELGRVTSTRDGIAIAWSVCEHLLNTKAYTLFVTHYNALVELEALYPNVKTFHLMVDQSQENRPLYKVGTGNGLQSSYGIRLAQLAGFPPEIITEVWSTTIKKTANSSLQSQALAKELSIRISKEEDPFKNTRAAYQLVQKILQLKVCYVTAWILLDENLQIRSTELKPSCERNTQLPQFSAKEACWRQYSQAR
eukprot:TRINITY_DN4377_c0_g1_i1.p1 TRINITY_DN4377_c0_g1~~TRINITY_DN4377_c0_g1_i1.p1  ORF type:complete len:225 (+),score=7.34 TRINITY_DN4377_c0_g1_i1:43-675(+)